MFINIATSARHVHLSQNDINTLFPAGLTKFKGLGQPGQYAANEKVDVVGPENVIRNVRVLGPARGESQLEVSFSDTRTLGLTDPQLRQSGKLDGLPTVKITSAYGSIRVKYMLADTHVHMSTRDAGARFADGQRAILSITGAKNGSLSVVVRVSHDSVTEAHIDTDESNAFMNPKKGVLA